ncbi:MAG: helix-turn-helix transcriptional regulator [Bdellovibrionales bacterium]
MVAISGPQLRAARGMLDWTREQLADEAGISQETVKNIEHGIFRPQESTTSAIIKAFAVHDVVFTENDGVQIKKDSVIRLEGKDGFKKFVDDIYQTAKAVYSIDGSKPICGSGIDDDVFKRQIGDYLPVHFDRMSKIKGLKIKLLAVKQESGILPVGDYRIHRYITGSYSLVPFYVYGNKLAIINFSVKDSPNVIIINSEVVADSYRQQFKVMWDNANDCS